MRQGVFYSVIFGFLCGVGVYSVWLVDFWYEKSVMVWCVLGVVSLLVVAASMKIQHRALIICIACSVFLGSFLGGVARAHHALTRHIDPVIESFIDTKVTVVGRIAEDPDERQTHTRLIVEIETLQGRALSRAEKVLVSTRPYTAFVFGEQVEVSGKLTRPENFETETGRVFDYVNYLGKDEIFYQISFAEVALLPTSPTRHLWRSLKKLLLDLKNTLVGKIDELFEQPEGALLAGVLFGEQAGLGRELQDDFRATGVIHIVVLSGFNVTVIAVFIAWFLGRIFRPRVALVFSILGIICFVILVGAGATIVRAGIMAVLAVLARLLGRENDVTRALLLAGFVMVLHNPKILVYDISFQLSFLATLGIIYVVPQLERVFGWLSNIFTLRETVVSTLAAQVFVMPLILYAIGEFSSVAPLVNVLVVPLVPASMLLGFLASLFGLLWEPLGMVFMIPTYLILHVQIKMVEWFGDLSFASVMVPQFPVWIVFALYVVLGLAFIGKKNKLDEKDIFEHLKK